MIVPKYNGAPVDPLLHRVISTVDDVMQANNDDYIMMCFGTTGTGKSSLMLHAFESYDPEGCDVRFIGLNKQSFATALNEAREKKDRRFCANDEANVSKRDHSSTWNKDLLDLYFAIRGLQIFHWWNNPSLDILDKPFIEERIKGFIYIFTKSKDKPRLYYFFRKADLLKLYEQIGNLKLKTLRKHAKKYAYYRGWFKKYDGKLWQPYVEKKGERMEEKVVDFFDKYGSNKLTQADIASRMGMSKQSITNYMKELLTNGDLVEGDDFVVNSAGKKYFVPAALEKFERLAQQKHGGGE